MKMEADRLTDEDSSAVAHRCHLELKHMKTKLVVLGGVVVTLALACWVGMGGSNLPWEKGFEKALAKGKETGKVVMLDFTAPG